MKENKKDIDTKEIKKKEKKEFKLWEKIFIYGNMVVIGIIMGIYIYRGIYYYKELNTVSSDGRLISQLVSENNIVYQGDGLYQEGDLYYYKGKNVNNYVYYSGRVWRIISISLDKIKMITDENQSIMVWGYKSNYEESYINKWLNEDKFIKSINDDGKMVSASWCNKSIDNDKYTCDSTVDSSVGLIEVSEYLKAMGKDSYLNNGTYFWTINYTDDNKVYYINKEGNVNNISYSNQDYYSYGVRPVININDDVKYLSGNGSKNDPYMLDSNGNTIKESSVGNYIRYNNYLWRVMEISDNVKLVLDDTVSDKKMEYSKVDNYLNQDFIKNFDKSSLVKFDYYVGEYNGNTSYNYQNKGTKKNNYVGGVNIGDLFIADSSNYWLYSIQSSKEKLGYIITEMDTLYGDLYTSEQMVKPVICVKGDLVIKEGNGTKNNPLVVGDKIEVGN